jgi:hypothetical protein
MGYRIGYHNVQDDGVTSSPGQDTLEDTIGEGQRLIQLPYIDEVWVRDETDEVIWQDMKMDLLTEPAYVCPWCAVRRKVEFAFTYGDTETGDIFWTEHVTLECGTKIRQWPDDRLWYNHSDHE